MITSHGLRNANDNVDANEKVSKECFKFKKVSLRKDKAINQINKSIHTLNQ